MERYVAAFTVLHDCAVFQAEVVDVDDVKHLEHVKEIERSCMIFVIL